MINPRNGRSCRSRLAASGAEALYMNVVFWYDIQTSIRCVLVFKAIVYFIIAFRVIPIYKTYLLQMSLFYNWSNYKFPLAGHYIIRWMLVVGKTCPLLSQLYSFDACWLYIHLLIIKVLLLLFICGINSRRVYLILRSTEFSIVAVYDIPCNECE